MRNQTVSIIKAQQHIPFLEALCGLLKETLTFGLSLWSKTGISATFFEFRSMLIGKCIPISKFGELDSLSMQMTCNQLASLISNFSGILEQINDREVLYSSDLLFANSYLGAVAFIIQKATSSLLPARFAQINDTIMRILNTTHQTCGTSVSASVAVIRVFLSQLQQWLNLNSTILEAEQEFIDLLESLEKYTHCVIQKTGGKTLREVTDFYRTLNFQLWCNEAFSPDRPVTVRIIESFLSLHMLWFHELEGSDRKFVVTWNQFNRVLIFYLGACDEVQLEAVRWMGLDGLKWLTYLLTAAKQSTRTVERRINAAHVSIPYALAALLSIRRSFESREELAREDDIPVDLAVDVTNFYLLFVRLFMNELSTGDPVGNDHLRQFINHLKATSGHLVAASRSEDFWSYVKELFLGRLSNAEEILEHLKDVLDRHNLAMLLFLVHNFGNQQEETNEQNFVNSAISILKVIVKLDQLGLLSRNSDELQLNCELSLLLASFLNRDNPDFFESLLKRLDEFESELLQSFEMALQGSVNPNQEGVNHESDQSPDRLVSGEYIKKCIHKIFLELTLP
ncbi:MAG: hypothetical protein NZO16_05685 [Deltaproteobacteria bacterium]|nr:hypothetical protein [Deltaproteobacteria bacterium]